MGEWVAFCDAGAREGVRRTVGLLDEGGDVAFAESADGLRNVVLGSVPGELGVVVGPSREGVSDINLAAAVVRDDSARCVVLLGEGVTGSLRSRAARAGIDRVVDMSELLEAGHGGARHEPVAAPLPEGRDVRPPGAAEAGARPVREGRRAAVLTFCSGRGGVGKTSVVAVAAAQAAAWEMSVCAVDLDLSCGNLYSCFGLSGGSDLSRLGEGAHGRATEGLVVPAAPGVHVAGPCERPETAELAMARTGAFLEEAADAFDLVLVDTSTTFTDAVAQAVQAADRLVIVSDGRPGQLSSLARTGGLAVRLGVARTRIARLENRASPRGRRDDSLARAELGLEAARVFRALEGGEEVEDLLASGRVVDLCASGSAFSSSVAAMLAQLLAELGRLPSSRDAERAREAGARRARGGLFGRRREAV